MPTQFITDPKGRKIGVFLSVKEYEQLVEAAEELADIQAYDRAKAKNEPTIPLREAIRLRRQHG